MNDKDIATLILSLEKALVKDYSVAITEASTKNIENKIIINSNKAIDAHRNLFDLMKNLNWYKIPLAEENKIKAEEVKLTNLMSTIDNE